MHAPTLAASAIAAVTLQAIAMMFVWFAQFRDRAVAELVAGTIATAVGAILALSRPALHPIVTHVIANMLVIGGQTFVAFALGRFLGRRIPPVVVVGVPILVGVLIAFFLYVEPRQDIRITVYSFGIAITSAISAALLLKVPPGPLRITHWPTGAIYLLQAVLGVARGIWVLFEAPNDNLFESTRLQVFWFSQATILVNATFIGLTLIVTQRPRLELDRQVNYDLLTDTLNRDAFERSVTAEWSRAVEQDQPASVLILEPDRFKALNDAYGSAAGDAWLKTFARTVRGALRPEDILSRYGGEEFMILLPQVGSDAAMQTAERIRRAIEELRLDHDGTSVTSTVSIGVATRNDLHPHLKSAIAAADRALNLAKAAGRNRVEAVGTR